jgi:hypothetical protein
LERAAKDRVSGLVGGCFQLIKRRLRLQRGDIGGGQVEGGEFGHLIRRGVVDAADQDTNMTHGALLGHDKGAMLPQLWLVPDYNLTQRLFALPYSS